MQAGLLGQVVWRYSTSVHGINTTHVFHQRVANSTGVILPRCLVVINAQKQCFVYAVCPHAGHPPSTSEGAPRTRRDCQRKKLNSCPGRLYLHLLSVLSPPRLVVSLPRVLRQLIDTQLNRRSAFLYSSRYLKIGLQLSSTASFLPSQGPGAGPQQNPLQPQPARARKRMKQGALAGDRRGYRIARAA
jgi:hypothetical protein